MAKNPHSQYAIRRKAKGFTLIELVMVIIVVAVLAGIGVPLTIALMDSFDSAIYRKDLSASAEVCLRRLSRELPRLKNNTSALTATSSTYRFTDIDNNTIQYQLSGNNLQRIYNGVTDTLATNVSSFTLSYLKDDGSVIPAPLVSPQQTNIRFVNVELALQSGTNTVTSTIKVLVRNVLHTSDLF